MKQENLDRARDLKKRRDTLKRYIATVQEDDYPTMMVRTQNGSYHKLGKPDSETQRALGQSAKELFLSLANKEIRDIDKEFESL